MHSLKTHPSCYGLSSIVLAAVGRVFTKPRLCQKRDPGQRLTLP